MPVSAASRVELYQASLLGPSNDSNLTWRLYVDSDGNMEDPKLTVTVLGFDTNLNVVCQWMSSSSISPMSTSARMRFHCSTNGP